MAKIRSSVALVLTLLNFIGTVTLFSIIIACINDINYHHNDKTKTRRLSQINSFKHNLRGTQLKLLELKSLIEKEKSKTQKKFDQLVYDEEEFVLPQKKEIDNSHNLRQLKANNGFDEAAFLVIGSLVSIFFTLILMISFCVEKNECCDKDSREELGVTGFICCLCCDDCECRGGGGDCKCEGGDGNGGGLIILLLVVIVFILIYFIIKACGKHISRYVSIIFEFLINLGIIILTFMYSQKENSDYFPIIYAISGLLALSNFLGILLPNLSCCLPLTYGYRANALNANEPILNTANTQKYPMPTVQTVLLPQAAIDNPSPAPVPAATPYYPPQAPIAYPQNNPPYQPQPINYNYYNNGQDNTYNVNPPIYQVNPQPQPIYQAQVPSQNEIYSNQVPKPQ